MPPLATDEEIGDRLKEARENAGLSQSQAAKLMGLDQPKISLIERGERKITPQELILFSEIYQVGYDWVLGQFCEDDLPDDLIEMVEKLPPIDRRKLLRVMASYGSLQYQNTDNP